MAKRKMKSKGKQLNKPTKQVNTIADITSEMIAAAYSAASGTPTPPVFLKVCRLCESKDGPFLNIFDADKMTAKKISDLMPFSVLENDDLPHKICFRCSAKLEELYEFIQKCIKTQESLRNALCKSGSFVTKSKTSIKLWEEKLNKSNMSNDDICDALIKKAMQGITGIPPSPDDETPIESKRNTRSKESLIKSSDDTDAEERNLQKRMENFDDLKSMATNRVTRSNKTEKILTKKLEDTQPKLAESSKTIKQENAASSKAEDTAVTSKNDAKQSGVITQNDEKSKGQKGKLATVNNLSFDYDEPIAKKNESEKAEITKREESPFNIMDHVSIIKVFGVGILFQCKLCNRNFLQKEVVESHSCAKNGIPKTDFFKSLPAPEPPKVSSVKYIKIDNDMKKSLIEKLKREDQKPSEKKLSIDKPSVEKKTVNEDSKSEAPPKTKPRPGPASKTRRNVIDLDSDGSKSPPQETICKEFQQPTTLSVEPPSNIPVPAIHFQNMPHLNGRFKLVPGPNQIFTLVEDASMAQQVHAQSFQIPTDPPQEPKRTSRKRKTEESVAHVPPEAPIESPSPDVLEVGNQSTPYPVGLFQTAHSATSSLNNTPPTFTTPAMKKQTYTVVQTDNPSKLLISTKAKAAEMEVSKKRQRKSKHDVKDDTDAKEPFSVTLEQVSQPKDPGFFTFINVDPLLQPSYVLPTNNIIQESQISTSSSILPHPAESKKEEKYSCNMCGDTFSREKKLLAHIQSHYTKMDEEDQLRSGKSGKKKARK